MYEQEAPAQHYAARVLLIFFANAWVCVSGDDTDDGVLNGGFPVEVSRPPRASHQQ